SGDAKAASVGGRLERRWLGDRARFVVDASRWIGVGRTRAFGSSGARLDLTSSPQPQGFVFRASVGVQRVGADAPMFLWPGAGEGRARMPLLRAHPLLADGIVRTTSVFGRSLAYGSVEQ